MKYYYRVFGLACVSDIELPAFTQGDSSQKQDFEILLTSKLPDFQNPQIESDEFCRYNESEFLYEMEETARFFVKEGKVIWIEPLCEDWGNILIYFYCNAIGALLFQKNLIPFHVSGVLDKDGGVWLFAAPSQTGKSTTALKLKERGFQIFTDDTALIFVEKGQCLAVPSYPMIRAWSNTLENQSVYSKMEASQINAEIDKYGIFFHEHFHDHPRKVKGIVFLEEAGDEIRIEKLNSMSAFENLANNIYRGYWIEGMKKQELHFKILTDIVKNVSFWKAYRPESRESFDSFAEAIENQIINLEP